jgi:hypothetical protein
MTASLSDAASGRKAAAAPRPAEAVQLTPAEQDYWCAAATKDTYSNIAAPAPPPPAQDAAAADAAAGMPQIVQQQSEQDEHELEKQAAEEAEARTAHDAAAVQGPYGELDEDWDDEGEKPAEAGQQQNTTQAAPQRPLRLPAKRLLQQPHKQQLHRARQAASSKL